MNETSDGPSLWIVGASIRAAALSARRAGFVPAGIDLFADWDTARCCAVERIAGADYPASLARRLPHCNTPWMYTGALENHLDVLDQLAGAGTLWGNAPEVVRRVRDPFLVAEMFAAEGIAHPQVRALADSTRDTNWLIKPLRGAGGTGIRRIEDARLGTAAVGAHSRAEQYLQQRIDGVPCAAVYVAARGRATLLGVTRQLVGELFAHAKEFAYCGSVGPMPLAEQTREQFVRWGNLLSSRFALEGIFGVDAVLSGAVAYPVEINPRWTASVEVLEYALGVNAVEMHAEACGGTLPSAPGRGASRRSRHKAALPCVGKGILYAGKQCVAPKPDVWTEVFSLLADRELGDAAAVADIPHGREPVRAGRPMITVLLRGRTAHDCMSQLRRQSQVIYRKFESAEPPRP